MFRRDHHQAVEVILQALNSEFLSSAECYFGGGTAPVLLLEEYRESVDIDFLCSSQKGYRQLLETVTSHSLGEIVKAPVEYAREIRWDQYGIRTALIVNGTKIKFEIVLEARIKLEGAFEPLLGVPVLSRVDLMAEKLLANVDRGDDHSTNGRDLIDLAMMARGWGGIPPESWEKAEAVYGSKVKKIFERVLQRLLQDSRVFSNLSTLRVEKDLHPIVIDALRAIAP